MRRTLLLLAFLLGCIGLNAQEYHINLHKDNTVVYDNAVSDIHEIRFEGSQPANMLLNAGCGYSVFPLTDFDSITFVIQELPPAGDTVYIIYNGNSVSVVNPF